MFVRGHYPFLLLLRLNFQFCAYRSEMNLDYVINQLLLVVLLFVFPPNTRKRRFYSWFNYTKRRGCFLKPACCLRPTTAHDKKQAEKNIHAGGILNPKSVHEGFRPLHTTGMYIHTRGVYLKVCFSLSFLKVVVSNSQKQSVSNALIM